jgi:hypothetical protein
VSPFETPDREGVGRLVRIASEEGRKARPGLKLGVCGEHGGDPDSVHFFHEAGLDYVSCSPFRVPVARLEAGRAALAGAEVSDSRSAETPVILRSLPAVSKFITRLGKCLSTRPVMISRGEERWSRLPTAQLHRLLDERFTADERTAGEPDRDRCGLATLEHPAFGSITTLNCGRPRRR